jgi:hypothetical protein
VDCLESFTQQRQQLFLDASGEILEEYGKQVLHGAPQGVGDAFYVWAVTYQATPSTCQLVNITSDEDWEYVEFPHDEDLRKFDRSDRKFVAVAIASGQNPTIFNATDSDWRNHAEPLSKYVNVEELCN